MMTEMPRTKSKLQVIQGGKPAPQSKDLVVKLRVDPPPADTPKPLTAEEIADLKILNGPDEEM